MKTIEVQETKQVWVAWGNTDRAEGKGVDFPKYVAESKDAAIRLGSGGYGRGLSCPVTEEVAFRINDNWYAPAVIEAETPADAQRRVLREAHEAAMEKAKGLGLTEAEIDRLRGY